MDKKDWLASLWNLTFRSNVFYIILSIIILILVASPSPEDTSTSIVYLSEQLQIEDSEIFLKNGSIVKCIKVSGSMLSDKIGCYKANDNLLVFSPDSYDYYVNR